MNFKGGLTLMLTISLFETYEHFIFIELRHCGLTEISTML